MRQIIDGIVGILLMCMTVGCDTPVASSDTKTWSSSTPAAVKNGFACSYIRSGGRRTNDLFISHGTRETPVAEMTGMRLWGKDYGPAKAAFLSVDEATGLVLFDLIGIGFHYTTGRFQVRLPHTLGDSFDVHLLGRDNQTGTLSAPTTLNCRPVVLPPDMPN